MKTIKIIITVLAFVTGERLMAQTLDVNNATALTNGTATFTYSSGSGCPAVPVSFTAFSGNSQPATCTASHLISVTLRFDDMACPPSSRTKIRTLTPSSPTQNYTDCSGNIITLTLTYMAPDWVVDIN